MGINIVYFSIFYQILLWLHQFISLNTFSILGKIINMFGIGFSVATFSMVYPRVDNFVLYIF